MAEPEDMAGITYIGDGESPYAFSLDQPDPIPNEGVPVWDKVIADMRERDLVGRARYGTPLQTHNGRDMLADAYAEALDMVVYLRGAMEERGPVETEPLHLWGLRIAIAFTLAVGFIVGFVAGQAGG